jgi:hypothetical protein
MHLTCNFYDESWKLGKKILLHNVMQFLCKRNDYKLKMIKMAFMMLYCNGDGKINL